MNEPLKSPDEGMREFALQISREKALAASEMSSQPKSRGKVESSVSASPMMPRSFEAPIKRQYPPAAPPAESSATTSAPCPFGEIITWTTGEGESAVTHTGIKGGYVAAGAPLWNVPNREIDLETDSEDLIWIKVGVTANCLDDGSATLSGLATSTEPEWESGPVSGGYPDKTIPAIFPVSSPGEGIIYLPIGTLTVSDGVATLDSAGCGSFTVDHCPGVLSFSRS